VRWCNIIVPNVHATSEDKCKKKKDSFTRKWRRFLSFLRYHIKILLGDFNAEVGRENIFKPTIGNESLHQNSNDNGVIMVNFATSKI
jgi:hypothetical protein